MKDLFRQSQDSLQKKSVDSLGINHDLNAYDSIQVEMPGHNDLDRRSAIALKNRAMSMMTFNTLGSGYTAPQRDLSYHIRHGLPFGKKKEKCYRDKTYMDQHVDWAKETIAPQKYISQSDWRQTSKERPNVAMNKAKKVSCTAELMAFKKKIPGPSDLKNMDPISSKPRTSGFYRNT